ncbi:hypothetical protein CRYUN_Cryun01aG0163800 [Craigia yunnanensis]
MHHQSIALKTAQFPFPPHLHLHLHLHLHPPNPIPSRLLFPPVSFPLHPNTATNSPRSAFSFRHVPVPNHPRRSLPCSNATKTAAVKTVDVATLGNLCVDIVLNVPKLPPPSPDARKAFMEQLSSSPPDKQYWEAGGNYVLHDEGIGIVGMSEEIDVFNSPSASYETLLCWVLVDPLQNHGFCSRADFSKEPAFSWMSTLSEEVKRAIKRSRILFCNGYDFDEFFPGVLISAVEYAVEVGTSVFFDPGPRGKILLHGSMEEQKALRQFLRMSDVLLLTSDEVRCIAFHRINA